MDFVKNPIRRIFLLLLKLRNDSLLLYEDYNVLVTTSVPSEHSHVSDIIPYIYDNTHPSHADTNDGGLHRLHISATGDLNLDVHLYSLHEEKDVPPCEF